MIALYSNTSAKKDIPAFEVSADGLLGTFLATDIEDLKRECRQLTPDQLESVIATVTEP